MLKNKSWKGFIEYVLFSKKSFGYLSCISLVMSVLIFSGLLIFAITYQMTTLWVIFGIMDLFAIRNLIKQRKRFDIFFNKDTEFVDLTVADTVNIITGAKEEKKEYKVGDTLEFDEEDE